MIFPVLTFTIDIHGLRAVIRCGKCRLALLPEGNDDLMHTQTMTWNKAPCEQIDIRFRLITDTHGFLKFERVS